MWAVEKLESGLRRRREREGHEQGVVLRVEIVAGAKTVGEKLGFPIKLYGCAICRSNFKLHFGCSVLPGPTYEGGKKGGCYTGAALSGSNGD